MRILWIFAVGLGFSILGLVSADSDRVVCYYTNWSAYRPGLGKFVPQNINPYLCTHLIYAFGGFGNDFKMKPFDKWQDIDQGGYAKFNGLKAHNKNLKTLIAIGGWNEGSKRFSKLVADPEARQTFIRSAIAYLRQYRFDGLDLDWEYPASRDGSKPADKQNYALFVKELRVAFENEANGKRPRLLLTMAVPAGLDTIENGYDVASLNKDLDFFNILSYDYHTAAEFEVNHHAPLRALASTSDFDPNVDLNIEATIKYYMQNGATSDKLVIGIPTYGRAFKLISPAETEIGAPAEGPAEAGKVTREKGYLAYYEICEKIGAEGWLVEKPEPNAVGPYAYKEYEWVGYDDEEMVARKAEYVIENRLGGIMFWAIDNDDFRGTCTGQKYPLIEAGKAALTQASAPAAPTRKTPNRISSSSQETSKKTPGSSSLRRPAASLSAGNRKPTTTTTTTTTTTRPKNGGNKNSGFTTTTTPEPPTTPDTAVEFTCTEEGFFPHPRDCKKYFWCLEAANVGLVTHTFTCPAGLHFNKFTDSCDYATNVLCSKPAAATTAKPLLGQSTTLATRPTTTRTTTTTTTTTTPEPELDYYDEEPVPAEEEEEPVDLTSPADLRKLLQLIDDLGGVSAVRRLLEENSRGSHGGKPKEAEEIQLTPAQRQALAQVIGTSEPEAKPKPRPSLVRKPTADNEEATPSSPAPKKYVTLSRQRTSSAPAVEEEEEQINEEETQIAEDTPTSPVRTNQNRAPNKYVTLLRQRQQAPQPTREEDGIQETENLDNEESLLTSQKPVEVLAEAQGTSTTAAPTTTSTSTEPATSPIPVSADIVDVEPAQSETFIEDEEAEEPEILTSTSTTTSTTTTITTTTTPRPTTTTPRPTTTTPRPTTTTSKPTTTPKLDTRRPRPFRPSPRLPAATSTTSTTTTPRTKAPIRITVKPVARPIDDEFIRIEDPDQQDAILGGSAASEQQQQQAVGLPNGNVVEIDEEGNVYCFDAGTFPYPEECKKFIQCARMESGELRGWIYTCPRNLTFDPVGGICNWGSPLRCRTL